MSETPVERKMRDFFGLPNGRDEYAKYMVEWEEKTYGPETKYTPEENLELYRLQYDYGLAQSKIGSITREEFTKIEDAVNEAVKKINMAAYDRQDASHAESETEVAWSIGDIGVRKEYGSTWAPGNAFQIREINPETGELLVMYSSNEDGKWDFREYTHNFTTTETDLIRRKPEECIKITMEEFLARAKGSEQE